MINNQRNINENHGIINRNLSEYALKNMYNIKNNIDEEIYFYFLISTFVLIEEKLIKKDNSNSLLYFNYDENKQYIPLIQNLVRPFITNVNTYEVNKTKVIIEGDCDKDDNDLPLSIWILNKIRDSFVHGSFRTDLDNQNIIIDNDKTDGTEYNQSNILVNSVFQNKDRNVTRTYTNLDLLHKTTYKLSNSLSIDKLEDFILGFDKGDIIVTKDIFESKYDKPFIDFVNHKIIKYDPAVDYKNIKELRKKDETIIDKTVNILNIMSSYIKKEDVSNQDLITFMYLYTDMFMIFASRSDEELEKIDHRLIHLHNWIINSNPENGLEHIEYNENQKKILDACDDFTREIENIEKIYPHLPKEITSKKIERRFNNLEVKLLSKYISRKMIIIKALRNAVMHNNLYLLQDNVYISDKNNQHDEASTKIKCIVKIYDLRNMVKGIEGIYEYYSEEEEIEESKVLITNEEKRQELINIFETLIEIDENIVEKEIQNLKNNCKQYIIKKI